MFTTLTGAALYVLALFPGIAFAFAREGHRPVGRRSALRELAGIVLVSAVCDVVISLLLLGISFFVAPVAIALVNSLEGNTDYLVEHYRPLYGGGVAAVVLATLLGLWLGSAKASALGLDRLWRSKIDRDSSGWGIAFGLGNNGKSSPRVTVFVGAQMKSGTWIQGQLHHFNNAGDDETARSILLVGHLKYRPAGSTDLLNVEDFGTIVLSSDDIEYLLVGYQDELSSNDIPESSGCTPHRPDNAI